MVIGSHNSWSYLRPRKWWMRPFAFMVRCQEVNIKEQYNLGVRCFDLRVKYNKDRSKHVKVTHGSCEFDYDYTRLIDDLCWLNSTGEEIWVRLNLDVRRKKECTKGQFEWFKTFCKQVETDFSNIKFFDGRELCNGERLYQFKNSPNFVEYCSSVRPPYLIDDWYPKWYAKKNNHWIKKLSFDGIKSYDFVNI